MNLYELAEADNAYILEDSENGFARMIKITDTGRVPTTYTVYGQAIRVGVDIDLDTGNMVPGNKTALTVRLSSLGVLPDEDWTVEFTDITGTLVKGKVSYVMLDRTAGRVTMIMKR